MLESVEKKINELRKKRIKSLIEWSNKQLMTGLEKVFSKAVYVKDLETSKRKLFEGMLDSEDYYRVYANQWRNDLTRNELKTAERIFYYPQTNSILWWTPIQNSIVWIILDATETKEDYLDLLNKLTEDLQRGKTIKKEILQKMMLIKVE